MLVERPDDDGCQVSRVDVCASDPHYVFDRNRADQLGITLGEIEAKVIDLAFNQELGNLCVLLKSKHKAAREIRLRNIELLGGDPLLDYPRDLGLEPPNCAIDVLGRGPDVSNEPARIKTRARGDVAERGVSKSLFVSEHARDSRCEAGTRTKNGIHHQKRVKVRIVALDPDVPDYDVRLFLWRNDESINRKSLALRSRRRRRVRPRSASPSPERCFEFVL